MEDTSLSTRASAVAVARMLAGDPRSKMLLTSDWHMYRALRAFEKAGLKAKPQPYPDGIKRSYQWHLRWGVFVDLVTETVKIGYYRARGWLS